jgi:hypothetical protein
MMGKSRNYLQQGAHADSYFSNMHSFHISTPWAMYQSPFKILASINLNARQAAFVF